VLAEDGKKMSKKLKNYPDPSLMFDKYGADALRYYLMASPVVAAQNLNFSEKDVSENVRGMLRMLWNSYSFFTLYASIDGWKEENNDFKKSDNLLDKWIVSELNMLVRDVNVSMEAYELNRAARLFPKFVDNLSNWYIRRSRKRFWKSEDDSDKNFAYATLHYVLVEFSKVMAPFMPFMADEIYKNLTSKDSVHLADFPVADESLIDEKLNAEMESGRNLISSGLQLRAQAKIKVRQPLAKVTIKKEVRSELLEIIEDELNVKNVEIDSQLLEEIIIDTEITEELRLEGYAREVVRSIQEMRKEANYDVENRIMLWYNGFNEVFEQFSELISREVLADKIENGEPQEFDLKKELKIEGESYVIFIKK
jgi:isoleucyl-tRNA synthetase